MGRILGIDYGNKRIGLAVTDPSRLFAFPLDTVSPADFDSFLITYMKTEAVDEFVIGYPVQMNNQPSESVRYINPFLRKFQLQFPDMKLEVYDERFTSKMAFQTMIDGGVKKKDRQNKALVDTISATIILQSYMESRSFNKF